MGSGPATFYFEPDARSEYLEAIRYYTVAASTSEVASRFFAAIDSAIAAVCAAPGTWRLVEPPDIRRFVLRRFPFVLYYRFQQSGNSVVVYAIMHTSRNPGYWRTRLPS